MFDGHAPVPAFRRASFCGGGGCVEVAAASPEQFLVRDAKDNRPDAPVLIFDRTEWEAFCAGVVAGEFRPNVLMGAQ